MGSKTSKNKLRVDTPWMTLKEVVAYARSSQTNLYRLIKQGRLHAGGTSRKHLFHRDHVDAQIQAGFPKLGPRGEIKPRTRPKRITRVTPSAHGGRGNIES